MDLTLTWRVVRRWWWVLVATTLAGGALGYGYGRHRVQEPPDSRIHRERVLASPRGRRASDRSRFGREDTLRTEPAYGDDAREAARSGGRPGEEEPTRRPVAPREKDEVEAPAEAS